MLFINFARRSALFSRNAVFAVSVGMLIAAAFETVALAQPEAQAKVKMYQVRDAGFGIPQVDGGEKQASSLWPATLKYYLNKEFSCTATLVGERAVITAGHCLEDNAIAEVTFTDGSTATLHCRRHPQYEDRSLNADIALCASGTTFPSGVFFENLDLRSTRIFAGQRLFLLGFGCRDVNHIFDPDKSGQLYGGFSSVSKVSMQAETQYEAGGGVVICPGDSGGSAYILAAPTQIGGPRSIVGINSYYKAKERISGLAKLSGSMGEFIRDWAADNNVTICGVHPLAKNCREKFVPQ